MMVMSKSQYTFCWYNEEISFQYQIIFDGKLISDLIEGLKLSGFVPSTCLKKFSDLLKCFICLALTMSLQVYYSLVEIP